MKIHCERCCTYYELNIFDLSPRTVKTMIMYARCPLCATPRDEKSYHYIANRCVDCHQPIERGLTRCRAHYTRHWRLNRVKKPVLLQSPDG